METSKAKASSFSEKLRPEEIEDDDERRECPYGLNCYRKNPIHFEEYRHPPGHKIGLKRGISSEELELTSGSFPPPKLPKENGKTKIPLGFCLSKVEGLSKKFNSDCYHLRDILALDQENFECSAHFNYMVDFDWFMHQFPASSLDKPLILVTGSNNGTDSRSLRASIDPKFQNVKVGSARLDIPFGTHHTKMMLLKYTEGVRVVIHTANLIEQDWLLKTQALYVTPLCPPLKSKGEGNRELGVSKSNFKIDLIDYLKAYKLLLLEDWIQIIRDHDFSQIGVYLIGSTPGRHTNGAKELWGHLKLRKVLSSVQFKDVDPSWKVIGQFSSIGSLGPSADSWLTSEFLMSLSSSKGANSLGKLPGLQLIFPTVENVRNSLEGYAAGGSLPYSIKTARNQPYLRNFMHQWVSEGKGRSRASPHVKTYTRLSPCSKKLAWFLVTSANLSKAAWGVLEKKQTQLMIRSYELGVLAVPSSEGLETDLLPYDVPLTQYSEKDQPWMWDIQYSSLPDVFGKTWEP